MSEYKVALTIAGSDPTGGAGLQADLRTFHAMGIYGLSVPVVLTAQNTEGVNSIHELPHAFVSEQMDVLLGDIVPDAVKTGMLYCTDAVNAVAGKMRQYSLKNLVVDPVAVSSSGVKLIEEKGLDIIKNELFPLARVITPNIYEAGVFTGIKVEGVDDMKEAAVRLHKLGPRTVIVTGGHLEWKAVDLLYDGEEFLTLENERFEGEFHGTGCVFSAAVAAGLAMGHDMRDASVRAKDFVNRAMTGALSLGGGMKVLNF